MVFQRTRPRELMLRAGPHCLSDAELLAAIISVGFKGCSVEELAQQVLDDVGGLEGLLIADVEELRVLPGVGLSRACRLIAAIELGRRVMTRPLHRGRRLRDSKDVDAAFRPQLAKEKIERFLAVPLDAKHRPMGDEIELGRARRRIAAICF